MSAPIHDQFAGLDVSRQRRYQLRKLAQGLCKQCGDQALPDMTCCEPCHKTRYKSVQRYQGKPKKRRVNTKFKRALEKNGL